MSSGTFGGFLERELSIFFKLSGKIERLSNRDLGSLLTNKGVRECGLRHSGSFPFAPFDFLGTPHHSLQKEPAKGIWCP